MTSKSTTKKQAPKRIKELVWDYYIGENIAQTKCWCCRSNPIKITDFVCGHVIATSKGGMMTLENLRPICGACNSSMGTTNMLDFIEQHKLHSKKFKLCIKSITPYTCVRCGYETPHKPTMRRHLFTRNKSCQGKINDIELTDHIKNKILENRVYRSEPTVSLPNAVNLILLQYH